MTNQGGGGGGTPVEWTQVWNNVTVATLANLATLDFPFDGFAPSAPQRDWLTFTTTNGSVLLDPGIYLFNTTFSYTQPGSGYLHVKTVAFGGFIDNDDDFPRPDALPGRHITLPASGFVDTGQPIAFQLLNRTGQDVTAIDSFCTIIKLS